MLFSTFYINKKMIKLFTNLQLKDIELYQPISLLTNSLIIPFC